MLLNVECTIALNSYILKYQIIDKLFPHYTSFSGFKKWFNKLMIGYRPMGTLYTSHDLRVTATTSIYVSTDKDIAKTCRILGHRDIATTLLYV